MQRRAQLREERSGFGQLLRNYDVETLDLDNHRELIIKTVLTNGTWEHVQRLFRYYGRTVIEKVVKEDIEGRQEMPPSSLNLWSLVFWGREYRPPRGNAKWRCRRLPPGRGAEGLQ